MDLHAGWLIAILIAWLVSVGGPPQQPPLEGGPCDDGTWGAIDDPSGAIHVRTDGDDINGDGSEGAPFASVARARDHAHTVEPGARDIAIGPGWFDTSLGFDSADDHTIRLLGCGPAHTVLDGGGSAAPVIDIDVNADLELAGLGITNASFALTIQGNAVVDLDDIWVREAGGAGVVIDGYGTLVTAIDLKVADIEARDGGCGAGLVLREGLLLGTGGVVRNTETSGVVVDGGDFLVEGLEVRGTEPAADGTMGRGLHMQNGWVILTNSLFAEVQDAGIFLLHPDGGVIHRIVIDHPSAGIMPQGPDGTGDGIVVRGGEDTSLIAVLDNSIIGAARAAILLDDVEVTVQDNWSSGSFLAVWLDDAYAQGACELYGADAPYIADISQDPLPINITPIDCLP